MALFYDRNWRLAVQRVVDVLVAQQKSSAEDAASPCGPAYTFSRNNIAGQGPLNSLVNGVGPPARTSGMIRSAFRPSDDACSFPFHVPANAMAVVELRATATLLRTCFGDGDLLALRCDALAAEIDVGIAKHGIVHRAEYGGSVFAYEVDGFGNAMLMDDANLPSLLALPWLGYVAESDPIYLRTRAYVLSNRSNPWFFSGSAGEGVGSPHTGPRTIWPLGIIMRALTSTSDVEIADALTTLKGSAAAPDSWLMHESFHANDASSFSRPWFAWANSLFAELVVKLSRERPHLVGIV